MFKLPTTSRVMVWAAGILHFFMTQTLQNTTTFFHDVIPLDYNSWKDLPQKFYIEKNVTREKLDLQIKHVSCTELEIVDKKVHSTLFSKRKKSSKKMIVLDFITIRGQEIFEERKEINPVEIKIEDKGIGNDFDRYKNNKVRFKPIGLLMASSVLNDT